MELWNMNSFCKRYFECLNCHRTFPMKDMAYRWYYAKGPKGLCAECNAEFIKAGVGEVDKLLQTKYKDFPEDHNFYFKVWNYMWSRGVIEGWWGERYTSLNQDEPSINYALCLIWEDELYFRNWGAEVQIYLRQNRGNLKLELLRTQQKLLQLHGIYQMIR